jgi:hypothetical protein
VVKKVFFSNERVWAKPVLARQRVQIDATRNEPLQIDFIVGISWNVRPGGPEQLLKCSRLMLEAPHVNRRADRRASFMVFMKDGILPEIPMKSPRA